VPCLKHGDLTVETSCGRVGGERHPHAGQALHPVKVSKVAHPQPPAPPTHRCARSAPRCHPKAGRLVSVRVGREHGGWSLRPGQAEADVVRWSPRLDGLSMISPSMGGKYCWMTDRRTGRLISLAGKPAGRPGTSPAGGVPTSLESRLGCGRWTNRMLPPHVLYYIG